MTDNEIIKAYEMCYLSDEINCGNCAFTNCPPNSCKTEMTKSVFELINRQKAEIERNREIIEYHEIVISALEKTLNKKKPKQSESLRKGGTNE